jgi:tRNA pseudouridine55 synthase
MTDGILNINKPEGPTSFAVVSAVKRLTGEKKVGHAGTLDPAASGVLPVCLGRATRVTEYLMESQKTYRAEIEFGKTTDTYDSQGTVTSESDSSGIDRSGIEAALVQFRGEIQQVPPAYSALKYRGKPYYELARAGIEVEIKRRPVTVYSIGLLSWHPPVVLVDITCGKGTYIRSLAHDLGQQLGCGAFMKSLVRRQYGPFSLDNAVSPEDLEQAVGADSWSGYVFPVDSVLTHLDTVVVNDGIGRDIMNGRKIDIGPGESTGASLTEKSTGHNRLRAYSSDGRFIGVLRFDPETERWQPEKIFIRG